MVGGGQHAIAATNGGEKYKQHLQLRPRVRGRQVHALGIRVVRVLRIELAHELRHEVVGESVRFPLRPRTPSGVIENF